ncbi:MAG: HdeD family acid-resistance protein [Ktedonobacteraceae bacterium]
METIRGVVNIIFGIILITHTTFTLHLLIYALGIYLLVDGTLDIFRIATGKRETQRKFSNYLFGIMSILLGLISFFSPMATIFIIVAVIAIRIFIRGLKVIIDARRSRRKYEGLAWIFGILLMIFGLAIFVGENTRLVTFVLFIVFIVLYAFFDGIYLIIRGLLLRFAPSVVVAKKFGIPEGIPDVPADMPLTTRRAIVFVRHIGANGLGHIGWAFEWNNGWFNAGSVENSAGKAFAKPDDMGFWTAHTLDPIGAMQKQALTYDEYKVYYVTEPRPKDAWKTVIWESRQPYSVLRHNCNDVAYDVLRAYGVTELLDPVEGLVPNDWFDAQPGPGYIIKETPVIPIHLHLMSKRELIRKEILLTIPQHVQGTPPPWRVNGWRAWYELNYTLDKMIKDVSALFVSMGKFVTRRQAP